MEQKKMEPFPRMNWLQFIHGWFRYLAVAADWIGDLKRLDMILFMQMILIRMHRECMRQILARWTKEVSSMYRQRKCRTAIF